MGAATRQDVIMPELAAARDRVQGLEGDLDDARRRRGGVRPMSNPDRDPSGPGRRDARPGLLLRPRAPAVAGRQGDGPSILSSIAFGIVLGMDSSITSQEVAAMGDEKVRENRLRRMAERQGLMLRKSRRRDPRAVDYGRYWLIDLDTTGVVAGGQFGIDLDDVESHLTADEDA
jgi:hypothetical protein